MKPKLFWFFFVDVNECFVYEPCRNNGTCINGEGSYTCTCEKGWKDQHCETGLCQTHLSQKSNVVFFSLPRMKIVLLNKRTNCCYI